MGAFDWPPAPLCRSASLAEAREHPGISHNATGPPAAGRSALPPEDKSDGVEKGGRYNILCIKEVYISPNVRES